MVPDSVSVRLITGGLPSTDPPRDPSEITGESGIGSELVNPAKIASSSILLSLTLWIPRGRREVFFPRIAVDRLVMDPRILGVDPGLISSGEKLKRFEKKT
jgi:hypothetical protein